MNPFLQFTPLELISLQWVNILLRYYVIAGLTYLICWRWLFPRLKDRFLYRTMPGREDRIREIQYSMITTFLFILPFTIILAFGLKTKLYYGLLDRGLGWYLASYLVVFFVHDTYFYWAHRAMHSKLLFKAFHRVHHLSTRPSPLAAFAFHPLEAIVEALPFFILPLVLPLHWSVLFAFTFFSFFMNVYGHLGFDLARGSRESFPLNLLNHSIHHAWHHAYHRGNYGFYLKFWDRVMGTWGGEFHERGAPSSTAPKKT